MFCCGRSRSLPVLMDLWSDLGSIEHWYLHQVEWAGIVTSRLEFFVCGRSCYVPVAICSRCRSNGPWGLNVATGLEHWYWYLHQAVHYMEWPRGKTAIRIPRPYDNNKPQSIYKLTEEKVEMGFYHELWWSLSYSKHLFFSYRRTLLLLIV